jgi:hypothetical protein
MIYLFKSIKIKKKICLNIFRFLKDTHNCHASQIKREKEREREKIGKIFLMLSIK